MPFTLQENNVVQTSISACFSLAFSGGFGMYLMGMGYQAYLNNGGIPRGQPGYNPGGWGSVANSQIRPHEYFVKAYSYWQ